MARRYFTNGAPSLQLASGITSSATTMTVSTTFSGYPATFPFFAVLEYGQSAMEIVSVTGVTGTTATIVRGQDGTAAVSHAAGATIDAVAVAKDLDEANAHVNSTSGVHGAAGAVVGTTDAQTLSNKTLASPSVTGSLAVAGPVTAPSFGGAILPTSYATLAALTAAVPTPVPGQTAFVNDGTLGLVTWNGSLWVPGGDTGVITSGVASVIAGGTLTYQLISQAFLRCGNVVTFYVVFKVTAGSIPVNATTGNVADQNVLSIDDARFVPRASMYPGLPQSLSTPGTTPTLFFVLGNKIALAATTSSLGTVDSTTFANVSISGTYLV